MKRTVGKRRYTRATTIKGKKEAMNLKDSKRVGIKEGLRRGKGKYKLYNYIIMSK